MDMPKKDWIHLDFVTERGPRLEVRLSVTIHGQQGRSYLYLIDMTYLALIQSC